MPCRRHASDISFTISPFPLRQGLFLTECSVYFDSQRQNPSWCLQVRISPAMPASVAVPTIWSASNAVGANTSGDSSPYPHSLSVKVLGEMQVKP